VILAGPDCLFEVLGGEANIQLGVALVIHVGVQAAGVETCPQQPLGDLDSDPAEADEALGQLVAAVEQLVERHGARYQADAIGLGCVDVTARQHDLEGARRADGSGQQVTDAQLGGGQSVVDAGRSEGSPL
jgi:hypothetical protein